MAMPTQWLLPMAGTLLLMCCFVAKLFSLNRSGSAPLSAWPVLGMLPSLLFHHQELHDWLSELLRNSGGTFRVWGPGLRMIVTCDAGNLHHILRTHYQTFVKGRRFQDMLGDYLGNSGLFMNGDRYHRLMTSASSAIASESFRVHAARCLQREIRLNLLPELTAVAGSGQPLDLQLLLVRFTFRNILAAGLGVDARQALGREGLERFINATETASQMCVRRFFCPRIVWKFMWCLRIGPEGRLRRARDFVWQCIDQLVDFRRRKLRFSQSDISQGRPLDLLSVSLLLDAESECDEAAMAMNIIQAGKDNIAVALTWFFWQLQHHPDVERRILKELNHLLHRRRQNLTMPDPESDPEWITSLLVEEEKNLHYLRAALSESLRLHPPTPFEFTEATADDVLPDGTPVKRDDVVLYSLRDAARAQSVWGTDYAEYRPERWLQRQGEGEGEGEGEVGRFMVRSELDFPVFNAGPRRCQGRQVAYTIMLCTAASIILRFRFAVVAGHGHRVEPSLGMVLAMKHGLLVHVHARTHVPPDQ